MRFDGKVALVTGSSRNLGKAVAHGFGKEGGSVVINARASTAELDATANEFREQGIRVLSLQTDITDSAQVDGMVRKALDTFGRIDNLVLSARIGGPHRPLLETTDEEWKAMHGSMHSTFYLLRAVLPGMLNQKSGHIVSIGGNLGDPGAGLLVAARPSFGGGRAALMRYVQRQYGPHIRVNSVSPGIMDTTRNPRIIPMTPAASPNTTPSA